MPGLQVIKKNTLISQIISFPSKIASGRSALNLLNLKPQNLSAYQVHLQEHIKILGAITTMTMTTMVVGLLEVGHGQAVEEIIKGALLIQQTIVQITRQKHQTAGGT
jgi:hypothetical protein